MTLTTREQQRAHHAFEQISDYVKVLAEKKEEEREKAKQNYGGMAHKLPILIRSAGLAQAVSFVETRRNEAHTRLLEDLAKTVARVNPTVDSYLKLNAQQLAEHSRTSELSEYTHLTREVLAACVWYKRFAESVLNVEQSESGES